MFRHGDVLIQPSNRKHDGLTALGTTALAEGTATGHSHRLEGDATLYADGDTKLLVCRGACRVTHQEHKAITLPAGTYRVSIKRQFDDVLGQRDVED